MANSKHVAHQLLQRAHSPEVASAIFTEKVLHKPLYLRPSSPDPTSQDARARRRLQRLRKKEKHQRGQRPRPLSAKEKRISGIYDIFKDAQKFDLYVPLHTMWIGYMWEILGIREGEKTHLTAHNAGSKLASADYHGAELTVVRSRCTGLVGLTGIVLRDTKFTFQIITTKNELKSESLCIQVKWSAVSQFLIFISDTKETYDIPIRNTTAFHQGHPHRGPGKQPETSYE